MAFPVDIKENGRQQFFRGATQKTLNRRRGLKQHGRERLSSCPGSAHQSVPVNNPTVLPVFCALCIALGTAVPVSYPSGLPQPISTHYWISCPPPKPSPINLPIPVSNTICQSTAWDGSL